MCSTIVSILVQTLPDRPHVSCRSLRPSGGVGITLFVSIGIMLANLPTIVRLQSLSTGKKMVLPWFCWLCLETNMTNRSVTDTGCLQIGRFRGWSPTTATSLFSHWEMAGKGVGAQPTSARFHWFNFYSNWVFHWVLIIRLPTYGVTLLRKLRINWRAERGIYQRVAG